MGTVASATAAVTHNTSNTTSWLLKDPLKPSSSITLNLEPGQFTTTPQDRQNIVSIVGRPDPVVLSDTFGLPSIELSLVFLTDAAYNAFENLRSTQHILLLQAPHPTGQWYVRMGPSVPTSLNLPSMRGRAASGNTIRTVKVTCQSVAAP